MHCPTPPAPGPEMRGLVLIESLGGPAHKFRAYGLAAAETAAHDRRSSYVWGNRRGWGSGCGLVRLVYGA